MIHIPDERIFERKISYNNKYRNMFEISPTSSPNNSIKRFAISESNDNSSSINNRYNYDNQSSSSINKRMFHQTYHPNTKDNYYIDLIKVKENERSNQNYKNSSNYKRIPEEINVDLNAQPMKLKNKSNLFSYFD